ncbi:hypothetical protein B0H13DRAFT_334117 [Mycena leptocephala]|nr:hypothetical protein B0H13DRAFT_334117 [Mycena leptocephala]
MAREILSSGNAVSSGPPRARESSWSTLKRLSIHAVVSCPTVSRFCLRTRLRVFSCPCISAADVHAVQSCRMRTRGGLCAMLHNSPTDSRHPAAVIHANALNELMRRYSRGLHVVIWTSHDIKANLPRHLCMRPFQARCASIELRNAAVLKCRSELLAARPIARARNSKGRRHQHQRSAATQIRTCRVRANPEHIIFPARTQHESDGKREIK